MKTKFDVNEKVLIAGKVKSIAVNEKGEIGYKVLISTKDGGVNVIIFDEDEIVEKDGSGVLELNED